MKRSFRRTLGAALALALALTAFAPLEVLAVSQSQIDALEAERDELSAEREEMEAGIAELEAEHADIMERKTALDERNELYRQEIELIEEQVELYTSLVEQKKLEVDSALERENEQLANYRRHVRAMEENGSFTWLAIIFGSKSLGELLSNIDMVGEIMEADRRSYEQYTAAREESERVQAEYEEMLTELDAKQAELEAEKAELEAEIEEAEQLIVELEEQLETDRAAYEEQLAKEQALESEIQSMIAELERQEAANSIVSTGTYIWPLPGYSPGSAYGWRIHPIWGDMRFHAGEDIGAPSGTPILAADSGIATVIPNNGNGYGNYIIINHGGGRTTLYAHMSAFAVSNGQSVTQGQTIGYVGSTGNSTGPHLHFEVRVNGATTDPKSYFSFG
ncbi:MAG TPA: peptidoglycan DD-metalloendopeptidase family protein [Candidatus Scatomorpha merdipullorum]|uniref:Peptidoglycan DD-metalloendopeptidase family protein n=1 Tax=Candidatus Scatomorpha merdipullorum TaxID=2840927 RepID=A0A9D1JUF0_9FIRM|nr:peptidoglycan DD-metalloendopeptidase family protein [Candidatus Scatomorpha merdipullorum]